MIENTITFTSPWRAAQDSFSAPNIYSMHCLARLTPVGYGFAPSVSNLDNVGVDLNMAVALAFLILAFLQNKEIIAFNSLNVDVFRYFIFAALTVCCVMSIVR